MAELIVTFDARTDLADIDSFLTAEAGDRVAMSFAARFAAALRRLKMWPGSGPPRPSLGKNTRIVIVSPFVIIYDHDPSTDNVIVLRVVHGRQRLSDALLRR